MQSCSHHRVVLESPIPDPPKKNLSSMFMYLAIKNLTASSPSYRQCCRYEELSRRKPLLPRLLVRRRACSSSPSCKQCCRYEELSRRKPLLPRLLVRRRACPSSPSCKQCCRYEEPARRKPVHPWATIAYVRLCLMSGILNTYLGDWSCKDRSCNERQDDTEELHFGGLSISRAA
jgi:hypothetical protein